MKKRMAILLTVCLVLAVGCGGNTIANNVANGQPLVQTVAYEEPVYQLDVATEREQFTAEDAVPLLDYSYQLLALSVPNMDALSPEDQAAVKQRVDQFNAQMHQRKTAAAAMIPETLTNAKIAYEDGWLGGVYTDETTVSGEILGQIVSVRLDNYSYFGGAHPNRYTLSLTFDLVSGCFIDPTQLADDPEGFRTAVAELLVEKADSMGEEYTSGYWADYRDIISHWHEGTVLFDESGMTVHYSPYEIGPYAMGDLDFSISYAELKPFMGPAGMDKLGMTVKSGE